MEALSRRSSRAKSSANFISNVSIDTFDDSFDFEEFMQGVTQSQLSTSSLDSLNIQELRAMLSVAQEGVESLLGRAGALRNKCNEEQQQKHADHLECVESAQNDMENVLNGFRQLESQVDAVWGKARRTGDKLAAADRQRVRAEHALELMELFERLRSGTPVDEIVNFNNKDDVRQAAAKVNRLCGFSKELRLPGCEEAILQVDLLEEKMEKSLLSFFEEAQDMSDIPEMKECASALARLNGGTNVVQQWVCSRPVLLDADLAERDEELSKSALSCEVATAIVTRVLDETYEAVSAEVLTVEQVFPDPPKVLTSFIQRLLEQRVSRMLEGVLSSVKEHGGLGSLLPTLAQVYTRCMSWSAKLQELPVGDCDIQKWCIDLFCTYLPDYFDLELQNLSGICQQLLPGPPEGIDLQETWAVIDGTGSSSKAKLPIVQFSLLAVEEAALLLEQAAGRSGELSGGAERASFLVELLGLLLDRMQVHVDFVLASTVMPVHSKQGGANSANKTIEAVAFAGDCSGVAHRALDKIMAMCLSKDVQAQTSAALCLANWERSVEESATRCVKAVVDHAISEINSALDDQKKSEFKPRGDSPPSDSPTAACVHVATLMTQYASSWQSLLRGGPNYKSMLKTFGLRVVQAYIAHVRKFVVSTGGGVQLLRDVSTVRMAVETWGITAVNDGFDMLREVSSIYIVGLESVPSLAQDGTMLSRMSKGTLIELVGRRSDCSPAQAAKLLSTADS